MSKLPIFRNLQHKLDSNRNFGEWVASSSPETSVGELWDDEKLLTPVGVSMHKLLVIQAFRPDRVLAMANAVVATVLGEPFLEAAATEVDLANIVEKEVKATNPVLMCSVPGYDASGRVDDLAAELGKHLTSIAIGSAEGFSQAEKVCPSHCAAPSAVILITISSRTDY